MDRQTEYPGQILTDVELLTIQRNMLIAHGWLAQAVLGTATSIAGLGCSATSPASLSVQVGTGAIFALENLDSNPYGSLAADTTAAHQIVKQGLNLAVQTLPCPAPTTAGQSINYLIEAAYQDYDTNSQVLQYFNSANPSVALTGPGGSGTSQNTTRQGLCAIQVKAGVAATTGSQTTPAVDSGFIALYIVTVAYGQTTITAGNIATVSGAPFLSYTLPQLSPGFGTKQYLQTSGTFTVPASGKIRVTVYGAGGGGGGAYGPSSGQFSAAAAGGQAGGYSQKTFTGLTAGSTISYVIGLGGAGSAGGSTTNQTGTAGGTTSFGSYITVTGGNGGQAGYSTAQTVSNGGSGAGVATGGDININGQPGGSSGPGGNVQIIGAGGGSCPYGGTGGVGSFTAGMAGTFPGGGGSGSGNSLANAGGTGANGLIVVEF